MKTAIRYILMGISGVSLILALLIGFNSASQWYLLINHDQYSEEECIISGTRIEKEQGADGVEYSYYLEGGTLGEQYAFKVSNENYRKYSDPSAVGKSIKVFRNPNRKSLSISFQGKSLDVILAEDWEDYNSLKTSSEVSMILTIAVTIVTILCYWASRILLKSINSSSTKTSSEPPASVRSS